jgi:hypothetical protein
MNTLQPKLFLYATALAFAGYSVAAPVTTPIPINSVPKTISSPGTYQVTISLISSSSLPAITINSPIAGKIILDLGGFTISEGEGGLPVGISIQNPTNSAIIVRNGILTGFETGINISPASTGYITNVKIQNITFLGELITSVLLGNANNCAVNNCNFVGIPSQSLSICGIRDLGSSTGNAYSGNVFDGAQQTALLIGQFPYPTALNIDCHVTPAP